MAVITQVYIILLLIAVASSAAIVRSAELEKRAGPPIDPLGNYQTVSCTSAQRKILKDILDSQWQALSKAAEDLKSKPLTSQHSFSLFFKESAMWARLKR